MDNNTTNQETKQEEPSGDHNWWWYLEIVITAFVLTGLTFVLYITGKPWSWWYLIPAGLITVGISVCLRNHIRETTIKKGYLKNLLFNILITTIIMTGLMVFFYVIDTPRPTIDEDMLGTDMDFGRVLYLYAGEDPTPPTTVDYTIKSYFGKPIGNVKYLITTNYISQVEFGTAPKNYLPYEVLQPLYTPDFQPKEIKGQLYIHANKNLKLQKGETRFVTLKIYADWLDNRPKGLEDATDYWTSEPIETVTVKLYG